MDPSERLDVVASSIKRLINSAELFFGLFY